MDEMVLARAVHVLGVILWIGGVAMVTTVLLPAVKLMKKPQERVAFFEKIEGKFAWQARFTTLITGGTGFFLVHRLDAWDRYTMPEYWWLPAMTMIWVLFTLMLFVLEPLFLHAWFIRRATEEPEKVFHIIHRMHWVLLTLSLLTVFGAMVGSHGGVLF